MSFFSKKHQKSQVYLFDLIVSFFILLGVLVIAVRYYSSETANSDIYEQGQELLDRYTTTNINSLNDEYVRELFRDNKVTNIENTVAQQVAEFYYVGDIDAAGNLTQLFLGTKLLSEVNLNLSLYNESDGVYYVLYAIRGKGGSLQIKDATVSSVYKRLVAGYSNETKNSYEYEFEVEIWE